jgi:hypothetical protein
MNGTGEARLGNPMVSHATSAPIGGPASAKTRMPITECNQRFTPDLPPGYHDCWSE